MFLLPVSHLVNLLKPSNFFTYHQVCHSKILHGPRLAFSVLCLFQNRQRLLLYTSLTEWFLPWWKVFTARYELIPYKNQITFRLSKVNLWLWETWGVQIIMPSNLLETCFPSLLFCFFFGPHNLHHHAILERPQTTYILSFNVLSNTVGLLERKSWKAAQSLKLCLFS
jgi:hypothetical protein